MSSCFSIKDKNTDECNWNNQQVPLLTNPKKARKRNREVENLKTSCVVASSELLAQPLRVTRSQWRRSISERNSQSTEFDYLHSSNPSSRSTSRSSSRAASPVFRLQGSEEVEEYLLNGEVKTHVSSRSQSPESKKVNSASSCSDKGSRQKKSTQTLGRGTDRCQSRDEHLESNPLILSAKSITERKNNNPGSNLNRGKSRTNKKTSVVEPYIFAAEEESKLSKTPIVLHSVDSKVSASVKERAANSVNKFASKDLWTSKPGDSTAKVTGKKRVRSLSKTQDAAVKRERKDNSNSTENSEFKATSTKTDKTGGRLSRARTSQAQTGERRNTTGSCASNR